MVNPRPQQPFRRKTLGNALRARREELGLDQKTVADRLGYDKSKIGRIENARVGLRKSDLLLLFDILDIPDAKERAELMSYLDGSSAVEAWIPHQSRYKDGYLLERDASRIRKYNISVIPGLFQTRSYTAALNSAMPNKAEVNKLVDFRASRQELVLHANQCQVDCVIRESALCEIVGDKDVMHEQVMRLVSLMDLANVNVSIIPFSAGYLHGAILPFQVISFPDQSIGDVVQIDLHVDVLYIDRPEQKVNEYIGVFDDLLGAGLNAEETRSKLIAIAKGYV